MNCSICNTKQTETLTHNNSIVCKDCFNAKQTLKHLHEEEKQECENCNECKYETIACSTGCYSYSLCDYHYVTIPKECIDNK